MCFQNIIEKMLEELNCLIYIFNKENSSICINQSFVYNEHLMYKELIDITSFLTESNIKFEIDLDNNILISSSISQH